MESKKQKAKYALELITNLESLVWDLPLSYNIANNLKEVLDRNKRRLTVMLAADDYWWEAHQCEN